MKTISVISAFLPFISVVIGGALIPRSDQSANSPLANLPIGCYSTGDAPDASTACSFKIDYCNGALNGNNCARFCHWQAPRKYSFLEASTDIKLHSNENYEIVCDNKNFDGCSKKQMAEGCSLPGSVTHHWWCTCDPFSKGKRQEVDAGFKPATRAIPQWEAPTRSAVAKLEDKREDNAALYITCS